MSLMLLMSSAEAKKSPCDALKPEQRITEEQQRSLSTAFQATLAGLKSGGGEVGAASSISTSLRVLEDEALAIGFFNYQACLLKESGVIDEATAQEIVRKLMGLEPAAAELPPAVSSESGEAAKPAIEEPRGARVRVEAPLPKAEVFVDGVAKGQVGSGLVLQLSPGSHQVTVKHRGRKPTSRTVSLVEGEQEAVQIAEMEKKSRWWIWAVAGAVVVGATIAIVAAASSGGGTGTNYTSTTTAGGSYTYYR